MSLPLPSPDQSVMITGASAGIGAELARRLGRRGHPLVLVARRADRLHALAEELRTSCRVDVDVHACDLSDPGQRRELVEAVRQSDRELVGLCNNAGVGSFGRLWELPWDGEAQIVRLNVEALHELVGAFAGPMVERGYGAILNVGSLAGFQPQPSNATYAASKAFVNSFSEALHAELRGTGVSATVVCPGPREDGVRGVGGGGRVQRPRTGLPVEHARPGGRGRRRRHGRGAADRLPPHGRPRGRRGRALRAADAALAGAPAGDAAQRGRKRRAG